MDSITKQKAQSEILTIRYSYNPQITPEMSKEDGGMKTKGWTTAEAEWNEQALAKLVRERSYIAAKLKDGRKKKENVEEVYFIVLDFDNAEKKAKKKKAKPFEYISKADFIEKAQKWQFSWFLHTTISHRKKYKDALGIEREGADKFRVWIPLSKPVPKEDISGKVKQYFVESLPNVDETCFQGDRYYFVSAKAEVHLYNFIKDNTVVFLDPDQIPKAAEGKQRAKTTGEYFSKELQVLLADGETHLHIKDLNGKTPIFCPWCIHDAVHRSNPNSANAFFEKNNAGQAFIYCSSENRTYWQDPKELDAGSSKLFFNTNTGCPTAIDYETEDGIDPYYVFKNDSDFRSYCNQYRIDYAVKDYLPRRPVIFDPQKKGGLHEKYYNIFEETEYMRKDYASYPKVKRSEVLDQLEDKTPVIYEVLINIFGEKESLSHFLNWIAVILQTRGKVFTAWLITSEEQGVGKDFMFNFILGPLFGKKQSQLIHGSRIGQQFNSMDLNCFLRGYNEVFSSGEKSKNTYRKEWLKEKITGYQHTIELKGIDQLYKRNFMNFILFSNNDQPIFLDQKDRRYNVVRNDKAKKVKELSFYVDKAQLVKTINDELSAFADIVFTLEADIELADEALTNSAREHLIKISADEYDNFAEAIKNGDAEFFMLDEIFPASEAEKMISSNTCRSNMAAELSAVIESRKMIPARFMNQIIKYFFPKYNYREVLKLLKAKNIVPKSVREPNGQISKAYLYEKTTEKVTDVTGA